MRRVGEGGPPAPERPGRVPDRTPTPQLQPRGTIVSLNSARQKPFVLAWGEQAGVAGGSGPPLGSAGLGLTSDQGPSWPTSGSQTPTASWGYGPLKWGGQVKLSSRVGTGSPALNLQH